MCFLFSFFPATIWSIIGYFVLFSSSKVEGRIKTLGLALAVWAFVIAGFILLAGAYVTTTGMCTMEVVMQCIVNRNA